MTQAQILTLTCPSCGAQIKVPEGSNRFTCGYCGNEHVLQISVQPVQPAQPSRSAVRPRVPVPASVRIVKDGQSACIVQRWFSWKYLPMAFFAVAWDSFLIFWYGMAIGTHAPWIFVVFPIAHLAVGIGITYSTLAGFFNRTTVELTRDALSVWYDPLPWFGEKTVKTGDLKQLFCTESGSNGKNGPTYSYQLFAITRADRQVKLIGNLDSPDVALFFEQQLETWLRIEDVPVAGEISRT